MTVKELIAKLSKLPAKALVVIQKDSEGNGYSPLYGAEEAIYRPDSTWSGEVHNEDEEEFERQDGDQQAVVLWPVN